MLSLHHTSVQSGFPGAVAACSGPAADGACQQSALDCRGRGGLTGPPLPAELLAPEGFRGGVADAFNCVSLVSHPGASGQF